MKIHIERKWVWLCAIAALVGCALSTGTGAVWRTAKVPPGSSVAKPSASVVRLHQKRNERTGSLHWFFVRLMVTILFM